jgi:hypothetical protein
MTKTLTKPKKRTETKDSSFSPAITLGNTTSPGVDLDHLYLHQALHQKSSDPSTEEKIQNCSWRSVSTSTKADALELQKCTLEAFHDQQQNIDKNSLQGRFSCN